MGNCCGSQIEFRSVSTSIDSVIEENSYLLNGLILYYIDQKELGVAMKLIKIQDLTRIYYSENREHRHSMLRQQLEEDDEYDSLVQKEFEQASQLNRFLLSTFNGAMGQIKHEQTLNQYIKDLEIRHNEGTKIKELYRLYLSLIHI